uniref:uncharacterized protein LOC122601286 n=1 Tax=Erigeron canadensis TaxID=72917 RepID=UPI001CB8DFE4|nr:uncharacterized protein LOC122601286 [Erigeron canadensis]
MFLFLQKSVRAVHNKFDNTLVGYFLGKRLAYPVVESYVKNAWAQYGIKRVMMNSKGFFFFKFETKDGMDKVLQQGPWLIRLNIADVTKVPIWIQLHNVPLDAFTEYGLSMLATKLGKPIALHQYTSSMCTESWGRSSFARALIELEASNEIKDELVVGIPSLEDDGVTRVVIKVEYQWKPPHCETCKVFNHSNDQCPILVKKTPPAEPNKDKDGFITVMHKKGKRVQEPQVGGGFKVPKKPVFQYRPKQVNVGNGRGSQGEAHKSAKVVNKEGASTSNANVSTSNVFSVLGDGEGSDSGKLGDPGGPMQRKAALYDEESDDDVETIYDETVEFMASDQQKGASTPSSSVNNV